MTVTRTKMARINYLSVRVSTVQLRFEKGVYCAGSVDRCRGIGRVV